MKKVGIIQARTGSTRLPRKVLLDLCGEPMLARVVERTTRATTLDAVVMATTDLPSDDVIEQLCKERGWNCFRGHESNVLDRYYLAAREHNADLVVRITSDNPLTDPEVIDEDVRRLCANWRDLDLVTNVGLPLGLAVEVMRMDALDRMHRLAQDSALQEHVTAFAYLHPELFRVEKIVNSEDLSGLRFTVDTAEDLELMRRIFAHFGHDRFSCREAVSLVRSQPDWALINAHVQQKQIYG